MDRRYTKTSTIIIAKIMEVIMKFDSLTPPNLSSQKDLANSIDIHAPHK